CATAAQLRSCCVGGAHNSLAIILNIPHFLSLNNSFVLTSITSAAAISCAPEQWPFENEYRKQGVAGQASLGPRHPVSGSCSIIARVFSDPPLTKRQLGWLIVLGGAALGAGTLAVNLFGLGRFNGIGPAKQVALIAAAAIILFGLSLVP